MNLDSRPILNNCVQGSSCPTFPYPCVCSRWITANDTDTNTNENCFYCHHHAEFSPFDNIQECINLGLDTFYMRRWCRPCTAKIDADMRAMRHPMYMTVNRKNIRDRPGLDFGWHPGWSIETAQRMFKRENDYMFNYPWPENETQWTQSINPLVVQTPITQVPLITEQPKALVTETKPTEQPKTKPKVVKGKSARDILSAKLKFKPRKF